MKKYIIILALSAALTTQVYAWPHHRCQSKINTVSYQTSAESAIKVEKAKVMVTLNSTINPQKAEQVKSNATEQLQKIVTDSEWSIENYSQQMTNSGLLDVSVIFKARLDLNQINQLNAQLDSLNTSGQKYTVANISYTPNLKNIESTKNDLRITMLGQINDQVHQLNQAEHTHYKLKKVSFETNNAPSPRNTAYGVSYMTKSAANESQKSLKVSQKITMTANVEIIEVNKPPKHKK